MTVSCTFVFFVEVQGSFHGSDGSLHGSTEASTEALLPGASTEDSAEASMKVASVEASMEVVEASTEVAEASMKAFIEATCVEASTEAFAVYAHEEVQ